MSTVNRDNLFFEVFNQSEYASSVEKHMLANQKVMCSILSEAVLSFCCPV